MTPIDRNCLSHWFPKLASAGLPVPRTEVVTFDDGRGGSSLAVLLDGHLPDGWGDFLARLNVAVAKVTDNASPTPPVFLRTGQGSGKHDWKRCCYVDFAAGSTLPDHVAALVEWSHLVDFVGLPHGVWAVREMLPVDPVAVLPAYGDMPLVKEVRAFVRGGQVVCSHGYWPAGAVADGFGLRRLSAGGGLRAGSPADSASLAHALAGIEITPDDSLAWSPLARHVAELFSADGAWSVDLLKTRAGWFVTDMAEAHRSFHREGCPNTFARPAGRSLP